MEETVTTVKSELSLSNLTIRYSCQNEIKSSCTNLDSESSNYRSNRTSNSTKTDLNYTNSNESLNKSRWTIRESGKLGPNLKISPSNSSIGSGSSYVNPNFSSPSNTSLSKKRLTIDDVRIVLNDDQLNEFKSIMDKTFQLAISNGHQYIESSHLRNALKHVGIDVPAYEARILEEQYKINDSKLYLEDFEQIYTKLKIEKEGRSFKTLVKPTDNLIVIRNEENEGIIHSVRNSEQIAFAKWINQNLADDPDLKLRERPIIAESRDLYTRCKDGLLLCKLVNLSVPNTIDERTLTKHNFSIYNELENLELAIRSAESIGCHVINIRPKDINDGKEHLILGLLWQIIQIGLFSEINLAHHPGLLLLLKDNETKEDLLKLTKEELLLRWMNYHLIKSGYTGREIRNFSSDIKDSIAYIYLLKQISPSNMSPPITLAPLNELDLMRRAEQMLKEAEKLKAREFVTANDVAQGNQKLNMAFVANLFNTYPALDTPDNQQEIIIEETREEKTFRNWMNAMGIKPFVNYIYEDLSNGLIIFQLYDIIKPGVVNWNKVNQNLTGKEVQFKVNFLILENCNYAIEIGKKQMNFNLVGIQGSDIKEKNKLFILALLWQLMRAYTLSLIEKLTGTTKKDDNSIVDWTNNKLKSAGKKTFIQNFQDPVISDSRVICDLIDAIKPNSIKYEELKSDGSIESKMENARYAVSMARRIGARVFALPEDIVEVKQKMTMTIFATLMIVDLQPHKSLD